MKLPTVFRSTESIDLVKLYFFPKYRIRKKSTPRIRTYQCEFNVKINSKLERQAKICPIFLEYSDLIE
jgi:hypothetical protein